MTRGHRSRAQGVAPAAAARLLLASLCTILVATACTPVPTESEDGEDPLPIVPADPDAQASGGGTLRIGIVSDPVSLDPAFVADDEGDLVVSTLFDPLVRLDDALRVVPGAARSWEVSDDGRTYRFELRPATFHDGTRVTAHDFVRAFERIADETSTPRPTVGFLLDHIEGIDEAQRGGELTGVVAEDDTTLLIRLSEPRPRMLMTLAHSSLGPVPGAAVEDPRAFAEQPVGNGPFMMLEPREPGGFVRVTRNDDHPNPPDVDDVLFTVYDPDPGGDEQWQDLLSGQLHVAAVVPDRVDEARELFGSAHESRRGPGLVDGINSTLYLYAFELSTPPFDDQRVRQALSMAIDREHIAEAFNQTRAPADAIVPPAIPGSRPGACAYCVHDPIAARQLWEEYLDEVDEEVTSLTLTHSRGTTHAAIAERMVEHIERALSVRVVMRAQDLQVFLGNVAQGEVGFFRLGWQPTEPHPGAYLTPMFHSDSLGLDNLTGFSDEQVDELLDAAERAPFIGTALVHWREAEALVLEQMPVLPLLYYRHSVVIGPGVEGLSWPAFGPPDLTEVSLLND